jgi:hypothetical protein
MLSLMFLLPAVSYKVGLQSISRKLEEAAKKIKLEFANTRMTQAR